MRSPTISTPLGWLYYAASTLLCIPGSVAQQLGLGNQVGEVRWREPLRRAASAVTPSTWSWKPGPDNHTARRERSAAAAAPPG